MYIEANEIAQQSAEAVSVGGMRCSFMYIRSIFISDSPSLFILVGKHLLLQLPYLCFLSSHH